jgi:hypothetical protein
MFSFADELRPSENQCNLYAFNEYQEKQVMPFSSVADVLRDEHCARQRYHEISLALWLQPGDLCAPN